MDFKVLVTVIAVLVSIILMGHVAGKFSKEDKSISSIIESAQGGISDYVYLSPEQDIDLCDYVGGQFGCESELGVTPFCELYAEKRYLVKANPSDLGVCINVTEV
ncbi:MAG: hypothetical protein GOV01_00585 [Candidatus Altiarchaeota archaeon]|nr:hypothetical protein [Candidatus Altiarchaeota archaeon]